MQVVRNRRFDASRTGGVLIMLAGLFTFSLGVVGMASAGATKPNPEHKVTLCHRTASHTNPYVIITVDVASVLHRGHDIHNGPIFFDGIAKGVKWGDIIPPFDFGPGEQYGGKNWTADGMAILAAGCTSPDNTTTSTTQESTTTGATTTSTSTTTSTTIESSTSVLGTTTSTPVTNLGSSTPTNPGDGTVVPEATTVAAGPNGTLPRTGSPAAPLLGIGLVLTASGIALARKRRWAN